MPAMLPRQDSPIAESGGRASNPFYAFLQDLERSVAAASNTEQAAQIAAIATALGSPDGTVGNIPEQTSGAGVVLGLRSIHSMGLLSDGTVWLSLRNDSDAPGNTYVYGTNATGAKGWVPVSDALAQGDGLTLTVGDDGVTTFALADLADTGTGTFKLLTRDTYGRLSGTKDGTTSDVPEGSNLYFTDSRADARIEAAKADPDGIASLVGGKLDAGQLPALAITDTFPVFTEAEMLALVCQQGDVAVRIDISTSFILAAEPASVLANWQELLSPTAGAVTSFNGRTGAVAPATGDYTPAQVGADPAGSAAAAQSAAQSYADGKVTPTIANGDATHAPSGDAVFDALAGKAASSQIGSGTYTPAITGITNITAVTSLPCRYTRINSTVTVYGTANVDVAGAGLCIVGISLPIASNFSGASSCSGVASSTTESARVQGDGATDLANMVWASGSDLGNNSWFFTFAYEIV